MVNRSPVVALLVVLLLALAAPASPTVAGAATGPARPIAQVIAPTPDPKTQNDLNKIDSQIAKVSSDWTVFQATNAVSTFEFYQVLWSHKSTPKDGVDSTADALNDMPTDKPGKTGKAFWDAGKMPSSFSARVRVDVYDGPRGKGYIVILQIDESGTTWERHINYGPETERDLPWVVIQPVNLP